MLVYDMLVDFGDIGEKKTSSIYTICSKSLE